MGLVGVAGREKRDFFKFDGGVLPHWISTGDSSSRQRLVCEAGDQDPSGGRIMEMRCSDVSAHPQKL